MALLEECRCLIAHLVGQALCFVGHVVVYVVVLLHESSDGLQLGIERFDTEGLAEHPRSPADDQCVLHIDALLALGKDELKELIFDGLQLTGRSINESLPVAGSPLRLDGCAQPGNFLAPLGQKWKRHAENFTGSADGEILLHTDPVAPLHKHDLLQEGIPPAGLASQSPKRPEEEGARHRERVWKSFFRSNKLTNLGSWGCGWMAHPRTISQFKSLQWISPTKVM